jgi:hypothetical protein
VTDRITVLCTTCFGALGCTRILAILPQRICDRCGKLCLGYQTVLD